MNAYFITGIHTDAGKTIASAFLQLTLDADYWKPIQAGDLNFGDTERVQRYTGLPTERYHRPRHELQTPASPHYAARLDGIEINLSDFELPDTGGKPLIVEGAGGVLVPINDRETILDLIAHLGLPVILVSRHYLGSINHTLLSIEVLRGRGCKVMGVLFSGGDDSPETVRIIKELSGVEVLGELPELEELTSAQLRGLAAALGESVRTALA